jgi:tRNA(Ile)-lysidine synthase
MQYRVLLKAVTTLYPHFVFEFSQWERYKEALDMKQKYAAPIGQGLILEISGRDLLVKRQKQIASYEYHVHGDQEVFIKEADVSLSFNAVDDPIVSKSRQRGKEVVDLDKVSFPLIVRNRTQGDRMRPLGMRFEKKLKEILIDKKMPYYLRDEIPLVVSKGKIVWCWGVGIADHFRISPQSKHGLEIGAELLDKPIKRD